MRVLHLGGPPLEAPGPHILGRQDGGSIRKESCVSAGGPHGLPSWVSASLPQKPRGHFPASFSMGRSGLDFSLSVGSLEPDLPLKVCVSF